MRRTRHGTLPGGLALALGISAIACGAALAGHGTQALSEAALGERIYRQGIGTDGQPVQARSMGDVHLSGARAACVSCHRPSGLGSAEGGYYVPPINGASLFAPRTPNRRRLFRYMYYQVQPQTYMARLHQARSRPAYTPKSLATALEHGIDAGGQPLASIMPRYQLTDADLKALDVYLHGLSSRMDPGVGKHHLWLATVFSDEVPAAARKAMLGTLRAYVDWHNQHLNDNLARPGFSPTIRSQFTPIERDWRLLVWDLKGPASTWRAQLQAQYAAHPVFALVGGDVRGPWQGPAEFCNAEQLPCLLPTTTLPAWPATRYSDTIYFSAGMILEAQVAAHFIEKHASHGQAVVQLAAADALGQVPAGILGAALGAQRPAVPQRLITYRNAAELATDIKILQDQPRLILVLWPGADVEPALHALAATTPRARLILLPSRAIDAAASLAGQLKCADRLRFPDPYELHPEAHAKSFETRAWLHARGLGTDHIRLRFKAYYAMNLLNAALFDVDDQYYRSYLVERIEDESQKDLDPGMYPWLAIAPEEHFAAKVAEIVRLDPKQPGGLSAVSGWIAP